MVNENKKHVRNHTHKQTPLHDLTAKSQKLTKMLNLKDQQVKKLSDHRKKKVTLIKTPINRLKHIKTTKRHQQNVNIML